MPIYEYQCRKCKRVFEVYSPLPHDIMTEECAYDGELGDRVYSLANPKVFPVFTTKNIMEDGRPVIVRSSSQLRQLESEHHVKMADADQGPPQTVI